MKKYAFIFFLIATHQSFAQFTCDSIHFSSAAETVNLPTNDVLWVKFSYDATNNPLIVYPFYYVILNDTSEVVVRQELVMSYIGDSDSIPFTVIYKNPLTPDGYTVTGTFDIHDPNANPNLICQFPFTLTVRNQSLSLSEHTQTQTAYSISPNPIRDFMSIRAENDIQEVSIFNTVGQEVYQIEGNRANEMTIDMSMLECGWYRLVLRTDAGIRTSSVFRQ